MKLQNKLLLPLMAMSMIPLLVFGGIAALYVTDVTRQQLFNEMESVLGTTAEVVRTHFKHARADIGLMSNSRQLVRYLQSGDERYALQQPALIRQISEYQQASPDYFEISLILADGFEDIRVVNRDLDNRALDESHSPLFKKLQKLTNDDVLTAVLPHADSGELVAYFARPMRVNDPFSPLGMSDERPKAFFVLALDMHFAQVLLDKVRVGKNGYMLITDKQGRVLFHPAQVEELPQRDVLATSVSEHLPSNTHKVTQYIVSNLPLDDQLNIVAVMPKSDLRETVNQLAMYVVLVILAVMLVIVLLIYQHVRKLFLEPIYKLRETVNRIGEGHLQAEIPQDLSRDEFGDLYQSIQKMRANLNNSQEQVKQLAYFDELTGLPNRITLKQELKAAINRAQRHNTFFAVVFIDLDNFKDVNDTLGHDMGDLLLKQVSQRIQRHIRTDDYVVRSEDSIEDSDGTRSLIARLGGDEFTLLLNNIENVSGVSKVMRRLIGALSQPVQLGDHTMSCGASMGISIYPQDGHNAEELLKNADLAMYEAKKSGKNHFEFYSKEMNAIALQRLALESNLRLALDANEFKLFYQPRICAADESIDGFEALIRWESPQMGIVSPNEFIPFAEESMLICEIGYWVLNTACCQIAQWVAEGYDDICVSVNLSPTQIYRGDTYHMIETAMRVNGVQGRNLEVEITESGLLKDEKTAIEFLHKVRGLGVRVALDDFGTGYSSLSYLRKLPIDVLKIDRSFVVDAAHEDAANVLESIIELASKLSLETVAEGVETIAQLELLRHFSCHYIQGYYYSKPLPVSDASDFLARHGLQQPAISRVQVATEL